MPYDPPIAERFDSENTSIAEVPLRPMPKIFRYLLRNSARPNDIPAQPVLPTPPGYVALKSIVGTIEQSSTSLWIGVPLAATSSRMWRRMYSALK